MVTPSETMTLRRQMGVLICLLFFTESVFGYTITDIPTLTQYAGRTLFFHDDSIAMSAATVANGDDAGSFTSVTGEMAYDLLYREKIIDTEGVEKAIYAGGYHSFIKVRTEREYFGMHGSLMYRSMQYSCSGASLRLDGNGNMTTERISFGGWRKYHAFLLTANVMSDIGRFVKGNTLLQRHPMLLLSTPVFDGSFVVHCNLPKASMSMSYENGTLFSGEVTLSNTSNSAYRRLPLNIDEHRIGLAASFLRRSFRLDCTALAGWFGGYTDEGQSVLPLSLQGSRVKINMACFISSLRMRPEIRGSITTVRCLLEGYDETGYEFLTVKDGQNYAFDGGVYLVPNRRNRMGFVVSGINFDGGNGMVSLYPFTNWLFLLDLPERYKFYYESGSFFESGLSGNRTFRIGRRQMIRAQCMVSGCSVEGAVRMADLVLYMHVLPKYENDRVEQFKKEYILVKGNIAYSISTGRSETTLRIQQMIPFELRSDKKAVKSEERATGESRRSVFGGFGVTLSTTLQW